ncbi:integrase core domain-containing protein [Myxococcota bacterium]
MLIVPAVAFNVLRTFFVPSLQRRRLAIKGKALTPKERTACCCHLVRPETLLDWFRKLAAKKYDSSTIRRTPGRPRKPDHIRELVIRLAHENPGWGYTKIRDALREPEARHCRATVTSILDEAGIEPEPERSRKRTWKQSLESHWHTLYACDFFAVETLGAFGAVRYMVFFVIELKTRTVQIAGAHIAPNDAWMQQLARNLLDPFDGFLRNATHLIHDRDPLYTKAWTAMLKAEGVECVPIPAHSPNCNPHAERFVRSIRDECLNRFVILGERHLRYLLREYVVHYNSERYHQGLGGRLITQSVRPGNDNGYTDEILRQSRLGGLLNFYRRKAA